MRSRIPCPRNPGSWVRRFFRQHLVDNSTDSKLGPICGQNERLFRIQHAQASWRDEVCLELLKHTLGLASGDNADQGIAPELPCPTTCSPIPTGGCGNGGRGGGRGGHSLTLSLPPLLSSPPPPPPLPLSPPAVQPIPLPLPPRAGIPQSRETERSSSATHVTALISQHMPEYARESIQWPLGNCKCTRNCGVPEACSQRTPSWDRV